MIISLLLLAILSMVIEVCSACMDPGNYKQTWFKMWDEHKKKGVYVPDFNTYSSGSNSANGNYKIYNLEVTNDYKKAMWARINDNDKLVPHVDRNMYLNIRNMIAFIKFDNNAKPDYIDDAKKYSMKVELRDGKLYVKDEIYYMYIHHWSVNRHHNTNSGWLALRVTFENVYTVRILNPEGYDKTKATWPINCNITVPYREFNQGFTTINPRCSVTAVELRTDRNNVTHPDLEIAKVDNSGT